jgi:hypothetical protein
MPTLALQSLAADGASLCVEFAWRNDRYQHVIGLQQPDGAMRPLLESVEGGPADAWPPSAPLQSLTIEPLAGDRRAAFLVGMAGRSHWSASIEARSGGALVFDLACRHGASLGNLGSRYRWLLPTAERPAIVISVEAGQITEVGDELTIAPAADNHTAATARWRFTLRSSGAP